MKKNSILHDIEIEITDIMLLALKEDIGGGDITTDQIIPADKMITAEITAKENGIICGLDIAALIFTLVDKKIRLIKRVNDGRKVRSGKVIAIVNGPARGILTAERTVLNFLQRLSGISTLTGKFVDKAASSHIKILDTRKTTPGLRALEKYAVKTGGGTNHRIGLFDDVLIKDNHISVIGDLKDAVKIARKKYDRVEVETKTFEEVKDAINSGATRIMLDNMSIQQINKAVKMIRNTGRRVEIEASGQITLKNIDKIAKTGVDYISIGAITHSAPALDINLKV